MDVLKENFPPRRRVKKAVSSPENAPALSIDTTSTTKLHASSNPVTPLYVSPLHTPQTPHHTRSPRPVEKSSLSFTPGKTPQAGLLERRKALEMEVDDACSDDEPL